MDCIKNPNGVKVVRKTLAFCRHLTPEQFHIEDNFCYFEEDEIRTLGTPTDYPPADSERKAT